MCPHQHCNNKKSSKLAVKWPWRTLYRRKWCNIFLKFRCLFVVYEVGFFCTAVTFFCKKKIETLRLIFFFNSFISALLMTIWCFILIGRTYCIQILREYLYFQSWNWEKIHNWHLQLFKYSTVIPYFIVGNIWVSHIVCRQVYSA